MSAECLKHRTHAQGTLTLEDSLLQLHLRVYPCLRKRTVVVIDVAHAVPCQMRRTGEI